MQGNMPSFINGITFERLSLGTVPFSILGVRHNPSLNSDHLGIGKDFFAFIKLYFSKHIQELPKADVQKLAHRFWQAPELPLSSSCDI